MENMDNGNITLKAIGLIRLSHRTPAGTPIQPNYAEQCEGEVIVDTEFESALMDLDGFERIWLVYWFDRAGSYKPRVVPYRDTHEHGLFATRSPCRPNPIGLSVVRLLGREGNVTAARAPYFRPHRGDGKLVG
jgi:tRNA-Thr(GGU) m(6)t(6)A37 methyltransferase TsaA